jgi:hypothetical protein
MPLDGFSILYDGPSFSGDVCIVGQGTKRYTVLPNLALYGMRNKVSSLEIASGSHDFSLILIERSIYELFGYGPYEGFFIQFNKIGNGEVWQNQDLGFFDNATDSAVSVETGRGNDVPRSVSNLLTAPWAALWRVATADTGVQLRGSPRFTWFPFPENISGLYSDYLYIKIQQLLGIGVPFGERPTLLTFYVTVFLENNRLRVNVQKYDYWVEPGFCQGPVLDGLRAQMPEIASQIDLALNFLCSLIPSEIDDLYLLPGNQAGAEHTTDTIFRSNTFGDVTLVFENPTTAPPLIVEWIAEMLSEMGSLLHDLLAPF